VVFSHVVSYIENQFEKTNSMFRSSNSTPATDDNEAAAAEEERLKYIVYQSSKIFTNVDCCLYLIMGRLKQVDIEYMKSIHELCNIIPVIIQPDLSLRPEIRIEQRLDILITMKTNGIKFSYLGYNYEELLSAVKQPITHPYCPPFILDYSPTKQQFHGLLSLKQAILQHQYKYLKYNTTEKFILWRQRNRKEQQQLSSQQIISSASASALTTDATLTSSASISSSQEQQIKKIKISQYITKRRHSLERDLLIQEKKLKQEFDLILKEQKVKFILKELNSIVLEQDGEIVIKKKKVEPMIYANHWIFLSILLSIFICYQNRHFLFSFVIL
jgi:hypothetical protein